MQRCNPSLFSPFHAVFFLVLSRNRPHVFVNHLEVPRLEITEASSHNKHVASIAKREVRLVFEADAEIQCSVLDGMGYEVHDFAVNLGIAFSKAFVLLLYSLVDPPAFLRGEGCYGHGDLWFSFLSHDCPLRP